MSADNWAVCPRCLHEAEAARDVALSKAREAYGVVPPEEFDDLRAEADRPIDVDALTTFREDYEFYGVGEGTITVSYSGHCHNCGLGLDFKEAHPFYSGSRPTSEGQKG